MRHRAARQPEIGFGFHASAAALAGRVRWDCVYADIGGAGSRKDPSDEGAFGLFPALFVVPSRAWVSLRNNDVEEVLCQTMVEAVLGGSWPGWAWEH